MAGEIRVIDLDMDLDLTPVERVSRMLAKGYLYGSHFLPHDAMATQKSGRTFFFDAWSRRITQEHRLVYRVDGPRVFLLQCRYRY